MPGKFLVPKGQGHFFVLDGVDGSGKGEQWKRLQKRLPELYPQMEFVFTREPGGSPYAEDIRKLILSDGGKNASGAVMAQLFGAARVDHLEKLVLPSLHAGKHVISDRFESSTYAYQIVAQNGGRDAERFFKLQHDIVSRELIAWHTFILDVDTDTAIARTGGREGQERTHFDARAKSFHEAVREGFRLYARQYSLGVEFVDARPTIDHVFQVMLGLFRDVLG